MIHCQQASLPWVEKTGAFSNSSVGFLCHAKSGDGTFTPWCHCEFSAIWRSGVLIHLSWAEKQIPEFFISQKARLQLQQQWTGRGTPTEGLAFKSAHRHPLDASVSHRLDRHHHLTDLIAVAGENGFWGGTPQAATSSNCVAITTATAPIHGRSDGIP